MFIRGERRYIAPPFPTLRGANQSSAHGNHIKVPPAVQSAQTTKSKASTHTQSMRLSRPWETRSVLVNCVTMCCPPGGYCIAIRRGERCRLRVNRVAAFAAHGSNSLKADSLPCASFTLSAVSRCNIARAGTWSYSMNSSIEVRLPAPRTTDLTPHEIKTAVATSPAHLPSRIGRL